MPVKLSKSAEQHLCNTFAEYFKINYDLTEEDNFEVLKLYHELIWHDKLREYIMLSYQAHSICSNFRLNVRWIDDTFNLSFAMTFPHNTPKHQNSALYMISLLKSLQPIFGLNINTSNIVETFNLEDRIRGRS